MISLKKKEDGEYDGTAAAILRLLRHNQPMTQDVLVYYTA